MSITRTPISKFNTIIKDSLANTGLNPISELCYGSSTTRILCYFDHSRIKSMVEDKTFPDISKFKHTLKIYNVGSVEPLKDNCGEISSSNNQFKKRAASFDLIFFLIPQEWDNGKGYDYSLDLINQSIYTLDGRYRQARDTLISTDASNWNQAKNLYPWKEEGVYSNEFLSKEYDKFSSDEGSSVIIGRQHFDIGNEHIELDITDIFNKFITGELINYGIGIAYTPMTELLNETKEGLERYTSFFTNKTNTFYEPYVETVYDDVISDDRSNFVLDKNNRLYLYCNIGGNLVNLDEIPVCEVDDKEYKVKQFSKGIYYIDINLSKNRYNPYTMLYDVWDNIKYQGVGFGAIEMDFTLYPNTRYFNFTNKIDNNDKIISSIYGIKHSEKIKRGDVRKVNVLARKQYEKNKAQLVDNMYARLYIKDGENREIEVFPYQQVNKTFDENYFLIDTTVLIPQRYYIDVKIEYNRETIISKEILQFDIVNEVE